MKSVMSKNRTSRIGLAVAVVAVVASVVGVSYSVLAEDQPTTSPAAPREERVAPDLLLAETVAALDCVEAKGFAAFGPYPLANGGGLDYSIRVDSEDQDAKIAPCLNPLQPYAMKFAFDNAPKGDGEAKPQGIEAYLEETSAPLATADATELWSYAGELEACLRAKKVLKAGEATGRADLAGLLGSAAIDSAPEFRACVDELIAG